MLPHLYKRDGSICRNLCADKYKKRRGGIMIKMNNEGKCTSPIHVRINEVATTS